MVYRMSSKSKSKIYVGLNFVITKKKLIFNFFFLFLKFTASEDHTWEKTRTSSFGTKFVKPADPPPLPSTAPSATPTSTNKHISTKTSSEKRVKRSRWDTSD